LASGACAWAAACLFVVLVFRLVSRPIVRGLAIALFLSDTWLWRWAFSGMETGLAMLVTIASLLLYTSRDSRSRFWSPVLLLSAGVLTRPEIGLLALLVMADYLRSVFSGRDRVAVPTVILSFVVAAVPLLLWQGFAHRTMGSVIPQTALVKSGVVSSSEAFRYAVQVLVSSQAVALALSAIGGIAWVWTRVTGRHVETDPSARRPSPLLPYGLWIVVLPAFYVSGGYVPLARYLLIAMPCLVIVGAVSLEWMATSMSNIR